VRWIVSFAFGLGINACAVFLFYCVYRQPADLFGGKLRFGALLLAATQAWCWVLTLSALAVIVHESGHAVAALRSGMTIVSIRLWPVDWLRRRRGMSPRRARSAKPPAAVFALPNPDRSIASQRAWFALGGPLANTVAAVFAGTLAWLAWNHAHDDRAAFAAVFAFLNATMAIANLLPIGRELQSDGTQLRKALKGETTAETDIDLLRFAQARLTQAESPAVAEPVLERWMNAPRPQLRALACYVRLQRELERGDMAAIAPAYSRLVETSKAAGPQGYGACVTYVALATLEFIYEVCMHDGKIEDAEHRMQSLGKWRRFAPRSTLLRTQAAIAFRRGKLVESQRLIRRAHGEAEGDFETALRTRELGKLVQLRKRVEAALVGCEEIAPIVS